MDVITTAQVRRLLDAGSSPCVSIFLPTDRPGREVRGNPAELKNLLREAEEALIARPTRPSDARALLEPARRLLEDEEFWMHARTGVAIYLSPGFFRVWKVPIEVAPHVIVNDAFAVKPLVPLLTTKQFYVLAISQNAVRLLECTPFACHRRDLPEDVATSLADAIQGEEEHQTTTERHGGDASNRFTGAGSYHGESEPYGSVHEDLLFFFRQLDAGVVKTIADEDVHVVLAGDVNVTPSYRGVSKLKRIVEETIHGNQDRTPDDRLHKQALEVMEPIWHARLNQQQERFGAALAHQLASRDVSEIVPAAISGRVDTLFVAADQTRWGRVDPATNTVAVHEAPHRNDVDLVDQATVHTLLTSGRIVVVDSPDQVPGNTGVAAIYRY